MFLEGGLNGPPYRPLCWCCHDFGHLVREVDLVYVVFVLLKDVQVLCVCMCVCVCVCVCVCGKVKLKGGKVKNTHASW